ncbi:hypothetical protein Glove_519g47 [Diversispora epigaea]|uniref:Uncharacterized protein n=1 Tax=Diversispora epigaea TaxID=1348612 RepID=A0A397GJF0_9GLOM|nr:hypothetical protein Glove_519g47 [Diversispora epigaea]
MAILQNKQVNGTKNIIGLYMASTDTSTIDINTLSNMSLSRQKLLILNIDNYHNLYKSRISSVTSINQISHMTTILLNTNNILPISLLSTFYNPNDITTLNEFNLVETLVIYCYDANLSKKHYADYYYLEIQSIKKAPHRSAHRCLDCYAPATDRLRSINKASDKTLNHPHRTPNPRTIPLYITTLNEFNLVETLVIYCYDANLSKKHYADYYYLEIQSIKKAPHRSAHRCLDCYAPATDVYGSTQYLEIKINQ